MQTCIHTITVAQVTTLCGPRVNTFQNPQTDDAPKEKAMMGIITVIMTIIRPPPNESPPASNEHLHSTTNTSGNTHTKQNAHTIKKAKGKVRVELSLCFFN